MPRVTLALMRKRSEHNDGALSTLEEIDLHQEGLTRLGPGLRRACPRLQHLSLSGNALGRLLPGETRGLRSLRSLGLALNCLRRLPPRSATVCLESLERLDLTGNFLGASALLGLGEHLGGLPRLAELWLMGNPCVAALGRAAAAVAAAEAEEEEETAGAARQRQRQGPQSDAPEEGNEGQKEGQLAPVDAYRACVVLALPGLARLDGEPVSASARLAARRAEGFVARALRRAAADEAEEEAAGSGARAAAVAALEASVLAGEEHPETATLYGPADAAVEDETSESDEDGDEAESESGLPPAPPLPVAAAAATTRRRPGPRRRRPRILETGTRDPGTGEVRRPWCPATRLLDLRDQRRQARGAAGREKPRGGGGAAAGAAAAAAAAGTASAAAPHLPSAAAAAAALFTDPLARRARRDALPPLPDQDPGTGETLPLRNEGRWRFSLDVVAAAAAPAPARSSTAAKPAAAAAAKTARPARALLPAHADDHDHDHDLELELDVDVGRHVDTSHMSLEVLPRAVRLLVRGRLLQLRLPADVRADAAAARRSAATGRLRVALPLERPWGRGRGEDPTLLHPRSVWGEEGAGKGGARRGQEKEGGLRPAGRAAVVAVVAAAAAETAASTNGADAADDQDDAPPPLL